jgi:general secretion pathway protein J
MRAAARRDAGLTLVELLVVLALLGLLAGLMAAGLRTAASGWQRIVHRNAHREELDAVRALLRGMLSRIDPARLDQSGRTVVRFEGDQDGLSFLGPLAKRFGAEDIVLYRLQFAGGGGLSISWRLDRQSLPGAGGLAPAAVNESITGCRDGSFAYYGKSDAADDPRWWPSWREQSTLPALIRARFTWRNQIEEIVVAPLVTGSFCSASAHDAACLN